MERSAGRTLATGSTRGVGDEMVAACKTQKTIKLIKLSKNERDFILGQRKFQSFEVNRIILKMSQMYRGIEYRSMALAFPKTGLELHNDPHKPCK